MASTYKILGQINPSASTLTTFYQTPAFKNTVCSTLSVCNQGVSTSVRVAIHPANEAVESKHYIVYNTVIDSSETLWLTIGLTLNETDVISVYANSSDISFNVYGSEIDIDPPPITPTTWVRNPSWLPMPATTSAQEQVDLLVAVYPESSYLAFACNTSSGTYTVDWGDGSAPETFASGVTAEYLYDADNFLNTDGPVVFNGSTHRVERTNHGYKDGMSVIFYIVNNTIGVNTCQTYYVINSTTDSFQLSTVSNGTIVAFSINGTGTLLSYRQAIVKITPTITVESLTEIILSKVHSSITDVHRQLTLDVTISANCSQLSISSDSSIPNKLERVTILRHNLTNLLGLFGDCTSLQSVPLFNTSSVTIMDYMFGGCTSLQSVPLFNTSSVTNMNGMFLGCTSLQSVPLFNTPLVVDMGNMFNGCTSLQSVPLFNTSSVTNMNGMFFSCTSLQSVPLFNTSSVIDMGSMFEYCIIIHTVPLFNTSSVITMNNMFSGCQLLETIPSFNTFLVTDMGGMFSYSNIQYIPDIDFSAVEFADLIFESCKSLSKIGSGVANMGPSVSFGVDDCKLSGNSLNLLYESLPNVVDKSIVVIGNPGIADSDPTIATAKGWSVIDT